MPSTFLVLADVPPAKVVFLWGLWILLAEAFPLVLLIFCWRDGDIGFGTKVIFTLLYLGHFGLLFVPVLVPALYIISKLILIALFGVAAFGWDWLTKGWPPGSSK